ncbi:MAG: anthranilate synthase component I [Thermoanaerobaculia bacterium]
MNRDEFEKIRGEYDVVPFVRELSADAVTPVSAFAALSPGDAEAFLFESVERGENVGRYSFVGFEPRRNLRFDRGMNDPAGTLNRELVPLRVYGGEKLPPFFGGAVGYFGYAAGGWIEQIPDTRPDDFELPDAKLLFFDNVVVFDHVRQRLFVIANVFTSDERASVESAEARLDRAVERLRAARVDLLDFGRPVDAIDFTPTYQRSEFEQMVREAKEEIVAGEIFQIVVSQRWETDFAESDALTLYRALRSVNPSPYMFLLRTAECTLVGASPEMLVRVTNRKAETRPIAGTRPRGASAAEDSQLEQSLLDDPKENAEHLMLVDLGRNDLGRVCTSGSVEVTSFRRVERYSHVMHLVSDVTGTLREDHTPVDLFLSAFPAGTVSGAPKIRAMQLIDQFEKTRRGPYAGAVAYVGFSGNLDSCIAIRTIVLANGRAYLQAGAGIVYDSDPATEFEETVNKSKALRYAVGLAKALRSNRTF